MASKRIMEELKDLKEDSPSLCSAGIMGDNFSTCNNKNNYRFDTPRVQRASVFDNREENTKNEFPDSHPTMHDKFASLTQALDVIADEFELYSGGEFAEALGLQVFALDTFDDDVLMKAYEYLSANNDIALKYIGYPPTRAKKWIETNMHLFMPPPCDQ